MKGSKFLIFINLAVVLIIFSAMRIFLIFSNNFQPYLGSKLILVLSRGWLEDLLVALIFGIALLLWSFVLRKNNSNLFFFKTGLIIFFSVELCLLFVCFVDAVYFSLARSHLHYSFFSFLVYTESFAASILSFCTILNVSFLFLLVIFFLLAGNFIIKRVEISQLPSPKLRLVAVSIFVVISIVLAFCLPKLFFSDQFVDDLSKNFLFYIASNTDKNYCHRADVASLIGQMTVADLELKYISSSGSDKSDRFFDDNYPLAKAPEKDLCSLGLLESDYCQKDADGDGYILAEDCDDNNGRIHPGAKDILNNGIDEDCDGIDDAKPNVILIFLESFGTKYITPEITPFFSKLTAENLFFSNFYSNGTDTSRSIMSSLCSILPETGLPEIDTGLGLNLLCLPQILKSFGYHNIEMQAGDLNFLDKRPFFEKIGFDEILGQQELGAKKGWEWGITDKNLYKTVAEKVESLKTGPFFLTIYTLANHHPFKFPADGDEMIYPHDTFARKVYNLLHYADESLAEFFAQNKDKDWFKNSIILVTADNSQPIGEKIFNNMNFISLYEENIWIPLVIVKNSSDKLAGENEVISSQIDIAPTILDLLGIEVMNHFQGKSLLEKDLDYDDSLMYSTCPYLGCMSAVRQGNYKIMKKFYKDGDLFYNLAIDRAEENNLAGQKSEDFRRLKETASKIYLYQYYLYEKNIFWSDSLQVLFERSLELKK